MAAPRARICGSQSRQRHAFRSWSAGLLCFALLSVSGCASTEPSVSSRTVECVPFAREVSGVQLRGDAADWWAKANGRYRRTQTPTAGSVLVFRRSGRLRDGHVAVVSRVLSERRILATHANWVRHQINEDVPVIDVSPDNDWTRVRVWWPPSNQMGITVYPTFGFIEARRTS